MIAPGGEDGRFDGRFGGFREENAGAAFAAPRAGNWVESGGI